MNLITVMSFKDELEKLAKFEVHHALDLAGLGILAAPAIKNKFTGKPMKEKHKDTTELVGLGTLGAGVLKGLGKHAMAKAAAKVKEVAKEQTELQRAKKFGIIGASVAGGAMAANIARSLMHPGYRRFAGHNLGLAIPLFAGEIGLNALGGYGAGRLAHRIHYGKASARRKVKEAADLWDPVTGAGSESHIRGSVLAKQRTSASTPLKPASSIRGTPYKGAPVAPAKSMPSMGKTLVAPRMAALGKVTSSPAKTGFFHKALTMLGHK